MIKLDGNALKPVDNDEPAKTATKTCNKCHECKTVDLFYKRYKTTYRAECKACFHAARVEYKQKWHAEKWANDPEYKKKCIDRLIELRETNPQYMLAYKIRKRMWNVLHYNPNYSPKSEKTLKLLGCTWAQFQAYIEAQFTPGMSWEGGFHLDHKVPIDAYDLTDPDEMRACCHYTNYQPLTQADNLDKRAKVYKHFLDEIDPKVAAKIIARGTKVISKDITGRDNNSEVKTNRIGQSATKLLNSQCVSTEKAQRLNDHGSEETRNLLGRLKI